MCAILYCRKLGCNGERTTEPYLCHENEGHRRWFSCTARREGLPIFDGDFSGQQDVGRDHKIARLCQFYDALVGHVHACGYPSNS